MFQSMSHSKCESMSQSGEICDDENICEYDQANRIRQCTTESRPAFHQLRHLSPRIFLNQDEAVFAHHTSTRPAFAGMKMSSKTLFVFLLNVLSLLQGTQAQTTTTDSCVCSPFTMSFTLDLSQNCPPANAITGSDKGIDAIFCQIIEEPSFGDADDVTDLVPVEINSVNIFELGLDLTVIKQTFLPGVILLDGDTLSYDSIIDGNSLESTPSQDIPGGLQIVLKGVNTDGMEVTNSFILTYTNRCDVVPFSVGDSIGWLTVESVVDPTGDFCPLFEGVTLAPFVTSSFPTTPPTIAIEMSSVPTSNLTITPTASPTARATLSPSQVGTERPIVSLSASPTSSESAFPTAIITEGATESPSVDIDQGSSEPAPDSPTASPTVTPTATPTEAVSEPPTIATTSSPTASPTITPSALPTATPTIDVTENPTNSPTTVVTNTPTPVPSQGPTASPSVPPTSSPTDGETSSPTFITTLSPTPSPTNSFDEPATLRPTEITLRIDSSSVDSESSDSKSVDSKSKKSKKAKKARKSKKKYGNINSKSSSKSGSKSKSGKSFKSKKAKSIKSKKDKKSKRI